MKSFRSRSILCAAAVLAWAFLSGAGGISHVIGSTRCRDCHEAAYEAWKGSAHARSAAALSEKERKDARCQKCHATAEGKFMEIGCEACHGGGRFYSFTYVMRDAELARLVGLEDAGEKTCARCHTQDSPKMRPFDLGAGMKAIKHWADRPPKAADGAKAR
jgi:formate-dependent nitrite reductase cytochrome c552 subunit